MNVLVTGASGFLGRTILDRGSSGNNLKFVGTHYTDSNDDTHYLDITKKDLINKIIKDSKIDTVIHCASLRNVLAEKDPNRSYFVNVEGTKNVIESCKKHGSHMIYISSDSVFDGTQQVNDENTKTNPLGIFGKHKVQCENMILETLQSYCIVRTSLLFGWDEKQSNFVQWLITELKKNNALQVISDQYVTPSYCRNITDVILEFAQKRNIGLYHVSGKECLTRFSFALKIAKIFNLDDGLIKPVLLDSLNLDMKRGKNCCLDTIKPLSLETHIMSLDEALLEMYNNQPSFS